MAAPILLRARWRKPPRLEHKPVEQSLKFPNTQRFVVKERGYEYLASDRATIIVAGPSSQWHLICQIQFHPKGSLFVQFPYFKESQGVLADAEFVSVGRGKGQMHLSERGRATTHHVKYHHPPDGNVHFSQDGRVRSDIRRSSFPLSEAGLLWELHAFGIEGFETVTQERVRRKRLYVPFVFKNGLPRGLQLSGEWRRKDEIASSLISADGPHAMIPRRRDGAPMKVMLLGHPKGSPCEDFLLAVNVAIPPRVEIDRPTMIFMGGWDSSGIGELGATPGTGCLAFMYPVDDVQALAKQIGSVDLKS